jgi:predicted helicase
MTINHRVLLASIRRFDQLIAYLRDEMGWPISQDSFSDVDDLFYDFTPEELGIDHHNAAKIQEIRRLRPLSVQQPWGIFFVKFEPKRLPVVALRRILSQVALKKRSSANSAERAAWSTDDLLFISNYGEGDNRQISFAHFSQKEEKNDLPTLKVLGWDNLDSPLHLDQVAEFLTERLAWPNNENDVTAWRNQWRSAFTLRHREVITTSRNLAIALAGLARNIRVRINTVLAIENKSGPVTKLMKAFKEALVHDLDEDGFSDMYAQTIAYGLLSARISNPAGKTAHEIATTMPVTNPFLRELMETFLKVGGHNCKETNKASLDFDELGVSEVVELLDNANMEAVLLDFGDKNPQEDPVIHFYELFLKEYDAKKRMQRGVFYTPRPIVSFIVRSVDEILRDEFGLEYGLADTSTWSEMAMLIDNLEIPVGTQPNQAFVQVLDPATGTGTFIVEVIDLIHKTMFRNWKAKGHANKKLKQLWNDYVPKHLLPRLHGYELMMAPYAIAHMKIGIKLYETGYRFKSAERARVYLTNSLEPTQDFTGDLAFAIPALAHEAEAVNVVKKSQRFTVVIGNPPYSGISSNMSKYAKHLVDAYKIVDGRALNERKIWLQDDYVKFIREAQVKIEKANIGVFGFITNNGYFGNPTFRGMRQNLMKSFNRLQVLDLHGNSNKKEKAPDGSIDKNVFDIRQGVGICLASRGSATNTFGHAETWGSRDEKYAYLTKHNVGSTLFSTLLPDSPYYFFEPQNILRREEYNRGWKITDAIPINSAGFITARDRFVIDFDEDVLLSRISKFANPKFTNTQIREIHFSGSGSDKYPDGDTRSWKVSEARERIQSDLKWREKVVRCLYRPFDFRYVYWTDSMVDWPRPAVMGQMLHGNNMALLTARCNKSSGADHFFCSNFISEAKCAEYSTQSAVFPLYIYQNVSSIQSGFEFVSNKKPNFALRFLNEIASVLGLPQKGPHQLPKGLTPEDIFYYAYAVFHSPIYRNRFSEFLKKDFPRLPLTGNMGLFRRLTLLGSELSGYHLMNFSKTEEYPIEVVGSDYLEIEKVSFFEETVWIDKRKTCGFKGVSEEVWKFSIGGYQVCEKWLKDRQSKGGKNPRPSRVLTKEDVDHYQKIIVAISETIRIMGEIDEVIEEHNGWPGAFQTSKE